MYQYTTVVSMSKIARRTTGAKGCYFLAGSLKVPKMFLKHPFKVLHMSPKQEIKKVSFQSQTRP